ncbi:MAG: LPS export ABC transporter periplasmic protein LptC [Chitinophagales bacterium]|nr:LPS export ABC transporter periplasmic protein LptC [Bacteroidota bacterium]MCB9255735.1 LPS export ABC transporter periplasmic protein LptC [Chitinophagales bacterium]
MLNSSNMQSPFRLFRLSIVFTSLKRILLFLLLLSYHSCTNDVEEVRELSEEFLNIEKGKDVTILFTEDALPTIRIEAPSAWRYAANPPDLAYTKFPDGLELYVYDKEGNQESVLRANEGKMADNSEDLEVNGDVRIENIKGEKLNTESLTWNKLDKKIRSDGFVKIFTNDEIIYGNGFEADENFTNYVIFNISGVVKIKDEEF